MATKTNIEWTRIAGRLSGPGLPYEGLATMTGGKARWTGKIAFNEKALLAPLKRKIPTRYFVNSMSDLFYEKVTDEMLETAFTVMSNCPQHTFQILTKRAERMRAYMLRVEGDYPHNNVWFGVSVEDQKTANERIPLLLQTPAAIRWLSVEPMLGPVDLDVGRTIGGDPDFISELDDAYGSVLGGIDGIDWVVVGGETGPGARPFNIEWCRSIINQCKEAGVPVFVKQLGAVPGGSVLNESPAFPISQGISLDYDGRGVGTYTARLKDKKGGDMSEWPEDLRIREFPQ